MDCQEGQFFIGKILLIGILNIIRNTLGAFIMFSTVFHDQLPEHFIAFTWASSIIFPWNSLWAK